MTDVEEFYIKTWKIQNIVNGLKIHVFSRNMQYVTIRQITIERLNELSKKVQGDMITKDYYRQMINLKIKPFIHSFVS